MRRGTACAVIMAAALLAGWTAAAASAQDEATNGERSRDPVFVQWLVAGDPDDETIREYWTRATRDELDAAGYVDLGTMLFHRGWPGDALRMYRTALDLDKRLYEAWYRIGLVHHRAREYEDARSAYRKCLKLLSGHGWCNFYLGLLEEQTNHPTKALEHYQRAFRAAPELADPRINPDVMDSKLQLGAVIRHEEARQFTETVPMPYLDRSQVDATRARYLPTPTPTATPTATPPPSVRDRRTARPVPSSGSSAGSGPSGGGAEPGGTPSGGRVRTRPVRTVPTPSADEIDPDSPYGVRRPRREPDSTEPSGGAGGYGAGGLSVSPQATIRPWWNAMPDWILIFV